jgi:hypothetical protein
MFPANWDKNGTVCCGAPQMRRITCSRYALLSLFVAVWSLSILTLCKQSSAQGVATGNCKPVSQRTSEEGCWILADQPVGQLTKSQVYWHLDSFPTRAEAEAAKGPRGTVIESLGKVWLMTIEAADWQSSNGEHIAKIGPLPVIAGEQYSAQFMEAISIPGMTSFIHTHSGPEAWYTRAGETCLETSEGVLIGRAGGPPVIVSGGLPMHLTATGTERRRALVLILHESAKPPTTIIHDWTPKGLCKK